MDKDTAIILIGHGGVPSDYPRDKVRRLMALEAARGHSGAPPDAEERALDSELRAHPRTRDNDPYFFGIGKLRGALAEALPEQRVHLAFNEFCAPSVQDAVTAAVEEGARSVVLITSMMTPGGSHSEIEIPEIVDELRKRFPRVSLEYAWPLDMAGLAAYMANQLESYLHRDAAE